MGGRTALVLGCGDVGSAIALVLWRAGFATVLADRARPAHIRRGMAFTDAWFDGSATLDGVTACFVVPERLDDFAWESDRIAHRTYGPAIITEETCTTYVDVEWTISNGKAGELILERSL